MASDDPNVRRYEEPRPVLVLHDDGTWRMGFCEGWSRWDDGIWRPSCTWSVAAGEKYVRSLPADRVRPADN